MKIARIPLQAHTRFHFGVMKFDHDLALADTTFYAHSDTLFSALVHSYDRLHESGEQLIDRFRDGSLKVSSLLFYLRSKNKPEVSVYFIPKPLFLEARSGKRADGRHKERNRIKFVSLGVLEQGFRADDWLEQKAFHVLQKSFVITEAEREALGQTPADLNDLRIAEKVLSPKSPQRSHVQNASIFYQTDLQIGDSDQLEIGWYCWYEAEAEAEHMFKQALNVMAYTGIGGEIYNTGRTIPAAPEFSSVVLPEVTTHRAYTNVGLLNPKDAEELGKVSFYQTAFRGGRTGTGDPNGKAKVVNMIVEGALISSESVRGRLVELGVDEQERTIYRNGTTLLIPIPYEV